jgi:hypothetical protein
MRKYAIAINQEFPMQATIKQFLKFLEAVHNNPQVLVTVVALAALSLAAFSLYVVLALVNH